MMSRRFIFGSLLLLQTAFSLLGNAGLHSALGCHHDHGMAAACTAPQAATKHQHCGCQHSHSHDLAVPASEEHQNSPAPLTDDDCAICQFFTRPAEVTIAFQWTPWIAAVTEISIEVVEQPGVLFESVYEVRGPPIFA